MNGCHNRDPLKPGYWFGGRAQKVLDSGHVVAVDEHHYIRSDHGLGHGTQEECRHAQHDPGDPGCVGCRWAKINGESHGE